MNKAFAVALIAAGLVSACGSTKEARSANPAPCPNVVALQDAARQIVFVGDETIENVAWTAEVADVSLACRYFADKPIDASIEIALAFGKGPKADSASHQFGYWVAVTRSNMEVIEKREFVAPVKFDGDENIVVIKQSIDEILIPRKSEKTSGTNFEVVVGLSVTPQQAIYNRSGKSLKFPDL
jgi:ABC-type Fe3+-hydroxamate transport system substrate-binding protein